MINLRTIYSYEVVKIGHDYLAELRQRDNLGESFIVVHPQHKDIYCNKNWASQEECRFIDGGGRSFLVEELAEIF